MGHGKVPFPGIPKTCFQPRTSCGLTQAPLSQHPPSAGCIHTCTFQSKTTLDPSLALACDPISQRRLLGKSRRLPWRTELGHREPPWSHRLPGLVHRRHHQNLLITAHKTLPLDGRFLQSQSLTQICSLTYIHWSLGSATRNVWGIHFVGEPEWNQNQLVSPRKRTRAVTLGVSPGPVISQQWDPAMRTNAAY